MSVRRAFDIGVIGERIDPGFSSTRALFDNGDMAGIQALAVRQAEAGACYLNISVGSRALIEPEFMAEIVRVVQAATAVPACFDFPGFKAQEACLRAYDLARADGRKPLVNCITEHRWEVMDLHRALGFKVVVMTSERTEGGVAVGNRTAEEIHTTGRRCALRLMRDYGLAPDDIYLDMSVSAIIADKEGLNRNAIEAIRLIGADSVLQGVHLVGGLSHIGQQLPPRAVGRLGPQARARVRVPHAHGAVRFRPHFRHALAAVRPAAGGQLRAASLPSLSRADRQQRNARGAQVLQGMTAQIIDGLALAHKLRRGLKQRAERLAAGGMRPGLAVVLVGDDPASQVYVRNKMRACDERRHALVSATPCRRRPARPKCSR